MKLSSILLPAAVAICLAASVPTSAEELRKDSPAAKNGWLSVSGTRLVNENGFPVTLSGVSFGWHNLWPRFYNTKATYTLARDWGCSVVRASIGAEMEGSYSDDPETALGCLYRVADAAIQEGIYVIADWHAHKLNLDDARSFFKSVAERYKGVPNVIYEIFNEPVDNSWEEVKAYSENLVELIRSIEPRSIILIGSPHWDQDVHIAADNPLTRYGNLMYTLHFYAGTHKKDLRDRADYALSKGLPLFVSECAGMNADGNGPLDLEEWMEWWNWMDNRGLSRVMWSLSDKDETCSMLLPSASSYGPWPEETVKIWGKTVKEYVRTARQPENLVRIDTQTSSLVLEAQPGQPLKFIYYGENLGGQNTANLKAAARTGMDAFPAYGNNCPSETAVSAIQYDGNMTLDLSVISVKEEENEGFRTVKIRMKDRIYPFYVDVCYKTSDDADIIETWTEITNSGKKPVVLTEFASGYLPVRRGDVWISYLYGSWANEGRVATEKLFPGIKVIQNRDGVRNSHTAHSEVMISVDGRPDEKHGSVIGAALCYSGNYELRFNTDDSDWHHFFAGINPSNSRYTLAPKETFRTPELALTYSKEGLGGVSRNFHRWARKYKITHGDRERKILLNSWEGVYFDINEKTMSDMMSDIASLGGELFVMDDGWFGDRYPRNRDNSSLGDWKVDRNKLPGGIAGLIGTADSLGIDFGIWVEPEMTNTDSELYLEHPDWVIKAQGRNPVTGRGGTQLVLDLSNPEVQDFIVETIDGLLSDNPGISYIKWDANMSIMSHGSQYLPSDCQEMLYIRYHLGFTDVCRRIREKYPDITIQACASGGGRANYGVLPWFDEFWVSDNTDALQRIYMQWGTSYFFPAIAMASHISASPNHQTFRSIPIKYRIDVAMSGRLGMEIQPGNMTEEELSLCRTAIEQYKMIREVVQFGDLYRLVSPYDGQDVASLMYCSPDKDRAVFYWWKLATFCNQHLPRIRMDGLEPERLYRISELVRIDNVPLPYEGMVFSGRFLMDTGLEIPNSHTVDYHKQNDWSSRILYLESVGQ